MMVYNNADDRNLTNLHKAMQYNNAGEPVVRTLVTNDTSQPVPVSLGGNDVVITGNVTIPGVVNVSSSPSDPVHVHLTEVGTGGILTVPWMPIAGNVTVDSGNIWVNGGTITANQGTTPWQIRGNVNAVVTSGNIIVQQGTTPWITNAALSSLPATAVTAFQEPLAVGITPVIQADAIYGLDPAIWGKTELRGGNVSLTNFNVWQVASGTSAGGYARLATKTYATYQPGQGLMFRWTAAFTTTTSDGRNSYGVDSIVQNTGPIDKEVGYSIGFSGSTADNDSRKIGILHRRAGFVEVRQLTVTTYPTDSQTATVTLNGTAYTISLTTSTSTAYTAAQIAQQLKLNSTVSNTWDIEACSSIVTFGYYSPGSQSGTYSFSSTGSGTIAVAAFSQLQAGASPIDTWTYVKDWNGTVPAFDPAKLNVFGMDFRWLGAGIVRFFMEDPDSGNMVLIHTQNWTKNQTGIYPHIRNPSLRITYRSGTTNTGVTPSQNVIVRGASVFAGVQGVIKQVGSSQGYYSVNASGFAKDLVHHLISIQNPYVRNGVTNRSSIILQDLTVSQQNQDPSVIFIVKEAVGTSDLLVFNPIPNSNTFLFAQYSTSVVTENLTLDSPSNIQTLGINASAQFDLKNFNLELAPGEYVSIFITSGGSISRTAVGITWLID